jgi:hypothetical protein
MSETTGDLGDAVAGLAVLGTVSELLPPVAALLAILWTAIRIYEWFCFRILGRQDKGTYK